MMPQLIRLRFEYGFTFRLDHSICRSTLKQCCRWTSLQEGSVTQAVESGRRGSIDRRATSYVEAATGVRRHSIVAAATIAMVTTNRPTTIILSTDPSC